MHRSHPYHSSCSLSLWFFLPRHPSCLLISHPTPFLYVWDKSRYLQDLPGPLFRLKLYDRIRALSVSALGHSTVNMIIRLPVHAWKSAFNNWPSPSPLYLGRWGQLTSFISSSRTGDRSSAGEGVRNRLRNLLPGSSEVGDFLDVGSHLSFPWKAPGRPLRYCAIRSASLSRTFQVSWHYLFF